MQCYEGKDKFIQKSILNALWSVMRGTTWTLQCIKNVIICTLIFQSISFESALNTLLFPAVLKMRQTYEKKNILNVHWSVMRGKTIYTKPVMYAMLWG